jgi:hypothetical protein
LENTVPAKLKGRKLFSERAVEETIERINVKQQNFKFSIAP